MPQNNRCEESPRTPEQIAKEYVDKQFAVMRKYGSLTKDISDREYFEIVSKIADLIQPAATRETRGTAPANLQDLVKNFVLKYMSFSYNCAADFDLQLAEQMKIVTEFAEVYAAERVSQPVAPPDAHRTLQTIFNELNDPESGESERWVKIEEILHQYFRGGTHPPQEGWISVEERLPEVNAEVLIWDGSNVYMDVYLGKFFADPQEWECGHNGVTHWQPLPKPPGAPSAPAKEPE